MSKKFWIAIVAAVILVTGSGYIGTDKGQIGIETRDFMRDYSGTRVVRDWQFDVQNYNGLPQEEYHQQPVQGYTASEVSALPTFEAVDQKVRAAGLYVSGRRQVIGTCVLESYENIKREELVRKGLTPPDQPIIDIDNSYYSFGYKPGEDKGSVPLQVFNQFTTEGLYRNYTPQLQYNPALSYQDAIKDWQSNADHIPQADDYRVFLNYKMIDGGFAAVDLFEALQKHPDATFRISIRNTGKVNWYNVEVPSIVGMDQQDYSGGHSVAGNGAYGVFQYQGEPAVYVIESYGSVNYHIVKLSVLEVVITSWELYEPTDAAVVIPQPVYDPLANEDIERGQSGDSVVALQEYLQDQGFFTYTGAKGYFGSVTANALSDWLYSKTGLRYSGNYWGEISRATYAQNQ